ncbi:unnamed protein product [Somion occarium]|uniref:G domain-containing protein n=1 Tax=Somion occarium TaxID=3059160 RepID=A0ABP1EB14_9APHY
MSGPPQSINIPTNGITIALMGATGTGKSTFANLACGWDDLAVASNLKSCTTEVAHTRTFFVDDFPVTMIDTPGFDDSKVPDSDILKSIASYLAASFEKGFKLSGIIYMHRISDFKMGGISLRNFSMFRKLCGDPNLKNVVIVTNMWSEVSLAIGEARERELKTDDQLFKPAYDKGAKFMRHDNTVESAHSIIRSIIKNHPEAFRIQQELVEERKDIIDVDAFVVLDTEMEKMRLQHKKELQDLKHDLERALENKDKETQAELRKVQSETLSKLAAMDTKHQSLSREYKEEKRKADERIQELMTVIHEERKRAEENHRRMEEMEAERKRENQQMLHTLQIVQDRLTQQAAQEKLEREHRQELESREREHHLELERIRLENERLKQEQIQAHQQRMERQLRELTDKPQGSGKRVAAGSGDDKQRRNRLSIRHGLLKKFFN